MWRPFRFDEEFPNYRYKGALPIGADESKEAETCNEVFDKFLAFCEHRVSMDDMALSTLIGYREILDRIFRPEIGPDAFKGIVYTRLAEIVSVNTEKVKKKTYNNVTSAVRTAFKFGYRDRPGQFNPALALSTFRITSKDRPKVDPFTIEDAETIIATSHRMHGEWYGNYEEFRFFTGLRQSEQFALEISDCNLQAGRISITKAVVEGQEKKPPQDKPGSRVRFVPTSSASSAGPIGLARASGRGRSDYSSVRFLLSCGRAVANHVLALQPLDRGAGYATHSAPQALQQSPFISAGA